MSGSLAERELTPERMDDPALSRDEHEHALRGLARLNALSGAARLVARPLAAWVREHDGERPLRVLDLATGSGDLPLALARRARRNGWNVEVHGCDVSERAIEAARARTAADGVEFFVADILREPFPDGYDVYTSSLFLHHLEERDAIRVLSHMGAHGRVIVSDLRRCRAGYWLAAAVPRLVTRSRVVHEDATLSVRNAFSRSELERLAYRAGLHGASIDPRWPFRMVLTWSGR